MSLKSDNPLIVKVGDLIDKKRPIEEIVHACKIAVEQKRLGETGIWHLLKGDEHEVYCGESSVNTIATDDVSIVECPECLKLFGEAKQ